MHRNWRLVGALARHAVLCYGVALLFWSFLIVRIPLLLVGTSFAYLVVLAMVSWLASPPGATDKAEGMVSYRICLLLSIAILAVCAARACSGWDELFPAVGFLAGLNSVLAPELGLMLVEERTEER